jgi:hypothetical protein
VKQSTIQWFIVQGHRLNTAEANPTLRRYCSLFDKDDRERLGRFVLETWIAQDTKPKYTSEEASAAAQREAQQIAVYAKQYPQYYPDFDQQRAYQTAFNRLSIEPVGSQTATKGILAVAGACCNGDAAANRASVREAVVRISWRSIEGTVAGARLDRRPPERRR